MQDDNNREQIVHSNSVPQSIIKNEPKRKELKLSDNKSNTYDLIIQKGHNSIIFELLRNDDIIKIEYIGNLSMTGLQNFESVYEVLYQDLSNEYFEIQLSATEDIILIIRIPFGTKNIEFKIKMDKKDPKNKYNLSEIGYEESDKKDELSKSNNSIKWHTKSIKEKAKELDELEEKNNNQLISIQSKRIIILKEEINQLEKEYNLLNEEKDRIITSIPVNNNKFREIVNKTIIHLKKLIKKLKLLNKYLLDKQKNKQLDKELDEKFQKENIAKIRNLSKELYEISFDFRLNELKVMKNDLRDIYTNLKFFEDEKVEDIENVSIQYLKEMLEKLIKEILNELKLDSKVVTKESYEKIINYFDSQNEKFCDKNLNKKLYKLRNLVEKINDIFYNWKEIKNITNKEIESEKNYKKIGKERLENLMKIDERLNNDIIEYKKRSTILIINFFKNSKNNDKSYEQIKICNKIYDTTKSIKLQYEAQEPCKNFESQEVVELISKQYDKEIQFTININFYQINHYNVFIDIQENKTSVVDMIYCSKNYQLLPDKINICGNNIEIIDSYNNMKRINFINLCGEELINFIKSNYHEYYESNKKKIIEISEYSDLFINIIINDKLDIIILEDIHKNSLNKLEKEDITILNDCFNALFDDNTNINFEKLKSNIVLYLKNESNNIYKIGNILKNMDLIPYYLIYKYKEPSDEDAETIKRIYILKLLFHYYQFNSTNFWLIINRIKYFIDKEKEFNQKKDNKQRIFVIANLFKYILRNKKETTFNYQLINMEDLPEYSPYIQAEINYRKIIGSLNEKSKLSFLFLQLNGGAGKDIITSKTWYKIKMIPFILIQEHLLKDFSPYFFIYSSSNLGNLAFNEPQTHIKSYNEYYYKKKNEKVAFHESELNTVKILFLKFHEYSHSKFSCGDMMISSPEFLYKKNLTILDNNISFPEKIVRGEIKYLYKNFFEKKPESQVNQKLLNFQFGIFINEINNEDEENYLGEIYHIEEDEEDDFYYNNPLDTSCGESGFAIEYYLANNYFCVNGIINYNGNLSKLLDVNLFIGESLDELRRYIERKIMVAYNRDPKVFVNNLIRLNFIITPKRQMLTYQDLGILVRD